MIWEILRYVSVAAFALLLVIILTILREVIKTGREDIRGVREDGGDLLRAITGNTKGGQKKAGISQKHGVGAYIDKNGDLIVRVQSGLTPRVM